MRVTASLLLLALAGGEALAGGKGLIRRSDFWPAVGTQCSPPDGGKIYVYPPNPNWIVRADAALPPDAGPAAPRPARGPSKSAPSTPAPLAPLPPVQAPSTPDPVTRPPVTSAPLPPPRVTP